MEMMMQRASPATVTSNPITRSWSIWIGIFSLALLMRWVYLPQVRAVPFFRHLIGDAARYWEWSSEILYSDFWGQETFYQAPLYPYVLAFIRVLVGGDLFAVRFAQGLLGAMACVVVGMAAGRWISRPAGFAAGILLAIYPPAIFFDGLIQKASLDLTLMAILLVALAVTQRRPSIRGMIGCGALLGLLALTRENALALVLVIVPWIWLYFRQQSVKSRLGWMAGFVAGLTLVLLPVGVRNRVVGGSFALTTVQAGPNFYIGNNPRATGRYIALVPGHESPPFERDDARRLAEQAVGRSLGDGEVSRYWFGEAMHFIVDRPIDELRLLGIKWLLVWNRYEIPDVEAYCVYGEASPLLRTLDSLLHFGVLCPLALFGVVMTWPKRRELGLVYGMILVLAGSVALFYVLGRYRYPLVPLLAIPAGAGIVGLIECVRNRLWKKAGMALPFAAMSAVVCNWPINPEKQLNAMAYSNVGTVLAQEGDLESAVTMFRRAAEGNPGAAEPWYNLGLAFALLDRHVEAVAAFERALQIAPDLVQLDYNLAVSLERVGQRERAVVHYRRAVEKDPADAEARDALKRLANETE